MEMNETMKEIESAIRDLCTENRPFTTVSDIAEYISVSERSVLNHANAVVRRRDDIELETIGKANVYYVVQDLTEEIWNEDSEDVMRLFYPKGEAEYVEIRNAPDDSQFDLEAHWYRADGQQIEGYQPSTEEIGQAVAIYATDPVSIKLYHDLLDEVDEDIRKLHYKSEDTGEDSS